MAAIMAGYGGSIGVPVSARCPGDSPMLPVPTVPPCLLFVLEGVRGVFTAPTFATFVSLVTGLLGATGTRTVTGMWNAAGLAGRSHHARAHRFFSHARWDLDSLGLLLAQ